MSNLPAPFFAFLELENSITVQIDDKTAQND